MKKVAVFAALFTAAFAATERSPEAKAWWSHVEFLASDALEGRKAGTPGHTKAANYVASQFDALGLKPGGDKNSYIQRVGMETRLIDESASFVEFLEQGKAPRRLKLGEEAILSVGVDKPDTVEAEVVFVGYGLKFPEGGIDDLAGMDLKGKLVLTIGGPPPTLAPAAAARAGSSRWKHLKAAGVIGGVSFADPKAVDVPWERSSLRRLTPILRLSEAALIENHGLKVGITVNPAHIDLLLAGTGHTSAELLELHRNKKPLPSFTLKGKIRAKTAYTVQPTTSENVIAVLPGSSKETVIISAHLDHLGIGGAVDGDTIYNGAMDNASGIASILEVAKALKSQKLKRTVVFLAATGEEGGLMGSKHFAAHPTLPFANLAADINLDMFLPLVPLKAITVYGMDESDLGPEFVKIAEKHNVAAERDPEPQRSLFTRSDQYSFIRKGIPSLSFKFHAKPGSEEAKVMKEWTTKRYHAPSDDLQQPVEMEAAVQFNRIMADFIQQVANREARPKWNKESVFSRSESE